MTEELKEKTTKNSRPPYKRNYNKRPYIRKTKENKSEEILEVNETKTEAIVEVNLNVDEKIENKEAKPVRHTRRPRNSRYREKGS